MRRILVGCAVATALAAPGGVLADDSGAAGSDPVQMRVRGVYLSPKGGGGGGGSSSTYAEFSLEWGLVRDWSMELAAGTPVTIPLASPEDIRLIPVVFTGKYAVVNTSGVRLYVGGGASDTFLSLTRSGGSDRIDSSRFSWVAQAGIEMAATDQLTFSLDIRYLGSLEPSVRYLGNLASSTVKIDPTLLGFGVGYRFR